MALGTQVPEPQPQEVGSLESPGVTSAAHGRNHRVPEACLLTHIYLIRPIPALSPLFFHRTIHPILSTSQQQNIVHRRFRPGLSITSTTMKQNMNIRTTLPPLKTGRYSQESLPKVPELPKPSAYIEPPETLTGINIHHFWPDDSDLYAQVPYYIQARETEYLPVLGESWVFKPRESSMMTTTTTTTTSTTTTTTSPKSSPPYPKVNSCNV